AVARVPLGYAFATFALGVFVLGTIAQEFWRGMRARQAMLHESAPRALGRLVGKNRRRYGGYLIHVGVVSIFVAIAASNAFRIEALDRRLHHGRRHAGHDVAVGGRAAGGGVRAGPGAGAGRVSRTVLALAALLLAAPAVATTQREVEESLTCQCGCGLTVHACNHLQCPSGEPMKKERSEERRVG